MERSSTPKRPMLNWVSPSSLNLSALYPCSVRIRGSVRLGVRERGASHFAAFPIA